MFVGKIKPFFININKKKLFLILALVVLLSLFYFSFLPVISPDSTDYYKDYGILKGIIPIAQWLQLRGPTLPVVIYIITAAFGDNPIGFLAGTFVFYLLMILGVFYITRQIAQLFDNKPARILTYTAVIVLIALNPVIIGYYHAMLTEFVAMTVAVVCCWMSYRWIDVKYEKGLKLRYVLFVLGFSILTSAMWLLKQPYITAVALPFLIASIISMIRTSNPLNILSKTTALFFCSIFVVLVSVSWSSFLCSKTDCSKGSNTQDYFSQGLINGLSSLRKIKNPEVKAILNNSSPDSNLLDSSERNLIANISENKSSFKTYYIYGVKGTGGKTIDLMVAVSSSDNGSLTNSESISFLLSVLSKHPYVVIKSYVKNYLATINVIGSTVENGIYYPDSSNYFNSDGENLAVGYAAFDSRLIYGWPLGVQRPEMAKVFSNYKVFNKPNEIAHDIYSIVKTPGLLLFTLTFLLVPILFIYSLVVLIKDKVVRKLNKVNRLNELLVILFGFSFLHVVLHALTGAIIDRYAAVAYPTALLGLILFAGSFLKKKKTQEPITRLTSEKLLFVIPAYNEELNIGQVIKDIRKNVPEADILVVNDCSKDNTRGVVEGMGVECVTMPFNVRYAMAVQTGIRYAYNNNYGYVIQFDADGQHLAKQARKLFIELKKTGSDIVIGSRFLQKTSYRHGVLRVVGTKMFSSTLSLLCGQNITDPTSGLQCLNGRVIEKYSRMGEYPEYPDANLIMDMLFKGYKIREVGVEMKRRENGDSMHSGILGPIKYMVKITYAIFVIVFRNLEFRRGNK